MLFEVGVQDKNMETSLYNLISSIGLTATKRIRFTMEGMIPYGLQMQRAIGASYVLRNVYRLTND